MKKSYRTILYFLVFLMVIGGVLLFIFRDRLLDFFQEQADLAVPSFAPASFAVSEDALDTSALNSPQFTNLVNNVIDFDFDNICYRPISAPVAVTVVKSLVPGEIESEAEEVSETAPAPVPLGCVKGNNLPFPVGD